MELGNDQTKLKQAGNLFRFRTCGSWQIRYHKLMIRGLQLRNIYSCLDIIGFARIARPWEGVSDCLYLEYCVSATIR